MTAASSALSKAISSIPGMRSMGKRIEKHADTHVLSGALCLLRHVKGLDEESLAEKMGMSVRRVQEIEQAHDEELRLTDFAAHATSLGYVVGLQVQSPKISDRIQNHCDAIQELLLELCDLCEDDDAMKASARQLALDIEGRILQYVEDASSRLRADEPEAPAQGFMISVPGMTEAVQAEVGAAR